jgi:AraC family transcriptional regulator of arabinose operon
MHLTKRFLERRFANRLPPPGCKPALIGMGMHAKEGAKGGYSDRISRYYTGIYLLRGSGTHLGADGNPSRVGAGDFIQHAPRQRCGVLPDDDGHWVEIWFNLSPGFAQALAAVGVLDLSRSILHPGLDLELADRLASLLEDLASVSDHELPRLSAVVHLILADVYQLERRHREPRDPMGRLIERACELLDELDADAPDVEHIASQCGLGYEHFRKAFRARMGVAPHTWRIRRRIDSARNLLLAEGLTVSETAARLGYSDAFTFSKQFAKYVGVSPSDFRRQHHSA